MNAQPDEDAGAEPGKGRAHEIHFTVDGEPYETTQRELTPNEIIRRFAQKDPATHYLVQIEGHHRESFQGKGDTPIKMHNEMKFQVISIGPTPVSDVNVTGPEAFSRGLAALGYRPEPLPSKADHIVFDYEVESGKFAGTKVRHGFIVPADFPLTPPSGPHVSPHIHPINTNGGPHPTGSVHQSHAAAFQDALGGVWQYWSRPFPDWAASKKTVAAYMSHIWRLWDSQ
jgi:hypothetical protein